MSQNYKNIKRNHALPNSILYTCVLFVHLKVAFCMKFYFCVIVPSYNQHDYFLNHAVHYVTRR